ncbi:PSD1 and planctomycete cytochrome C domain-containing protein [Fimbriiglobus ruber]|uniref:Cytochrome c domain-containing protein n=1 Tax=Fimbriiglobus ruber TaxID=1908690 RepID=A0A225DVJ1_9BACT|nr:PSD1 and planctomycete cytochrome C domain-containing protein [Fimbriiglobus ruber]OWK40325.1 hypothetical protein FRUB_05244 [Fimbriiglobus ruber]
MTIRTPFRFLLVAVAAVGLSSAAGAQSAAVEHFEKKVRPVLIEHCASCHGADGKKIKGGLRTSSRADLLAGGDTGPAIVPGKPAESLLVLAVKYDGELKMPPAGKLKDAEIAAITEWVKVGAPWPDTAGATVATTPVKKDGPLFTEEQKRFWAFHPVKAEKPPAVKDEKWVRSPVDAFLLAKLEVADLAPAPPADKRALIRRATFDLTGLPPTPAEIDAFLADNSSSAFATVVDRLLASPAYGERWGRHWLDVARYADSNGLDENTAFGNAWRYRDYVVRAFNADKPYDEFLREQIAGDLLPATTDHAVRDDRYTALGYLVIGAKLLAEPDKQKMLLDIADEQLDVFGKGVMGLTLGCARCHDHKFDPLPTRDYYSLLGIFTSTRTMQNLNTVAKAFERNLGEPEKPEIVAARARLEKLRKELRELEKAFGKTPEKEKEKRTEIHNKAEAARAEIKTLEPKIPPVVSVLSVEEGSAAAYGTQPRNLHVQVRGNYTTPGEEAPSVFLRVLGGEKQTSFVSTNPNTADKPQPNKTRFGSVRTGSGRLELARWVTDPQHPLTARVFVNRVWQHHFGNGLVRSPDNFGRLGDRPTHPELLDWLATRFVQDGWSVKKLHRVMMLSNAYQMSTRYDARAALADPDDRLLWRYPRLRVEPEAIRDAMLAVGGNLDTTIGGTLYKGGNFEYVTNDQSSDKVGYDTTRRSIYLPVIRNNVFPFFQTFDFPDPSTMLGKRESTVVAPQALFLMNSPFAANQAAAFADRLFKAEPNDDRARVGLGYRLAFGRLVTDVEASRAAEFVAHYQTMLEKTEADKAKRRAKAWQALCQALFASNEFVYLN